MKALRSRTWFFVLAITVLWVGAIGQPPVPNDDGLLAPNSADESEWKTVEDLPANLHALIDSLYAARNRHRTALDDAVSAFSVDQLTVPQSVVTLCNKYNVLCGVEVVPWPAGGSGLKTPHLAPISLSMANTTPRKILDNLVTLDPTFTWAEDRGTANVVLRSAYCSPTYPLNLAVDHLTATDRPYSRVFFSPDSVGLFQLPQVSPALPISSSGRWPQKFEPQITIDVRDESVRATVNRVAREVGMSWTLVWSECQPPTSCLPMARFSMTPQVWIPRWKDPEAKVQPASTP